LSTIELEQPLEIIDEDPRIAERRRAVEMERRGRRRRWCLTVLVLFTVVAGGWLITRTALFDVDEIRVAGVAHQSVEQVLEASGVRPGDQILDIDPDSVATRVGALPWIGGVEVERRLDGVVVIVVSERSAVALVADPAGGRHLIDSTGRLLGPADGDTTGLMLLEGLAPGDAGATVDRSEGPLELLAALTPGVRSRVAAIVASEDGSLQLRLVPRAMVHLGPPIDLTAKVAWLPTVLGQVDQAGVTSIDLTDPGTAVLSR
jgi:cell division protein FtsQ